MIRIPVVCLALAGALLAAAPVAQAAFPGANGPIVFEEALSSGFYTVNSDGSGRTLILPAAGTRTDDPAYSPDGAKLVYSRGLNLWVAGADGSAPRQVTTGTNNDQGAAFSPDGRQLVFTRIAEGDLFVVNLDGTGLRNLTNDPEGQEYEPAWSPDGTRIAYQRDTSAGEGSIYSIAADGTGRTSLTPEQSPAPTCDPDHKSRSSDPSWSPDGTRIAFTGSSVCVGTQSQYGTDIWIMSPTGAGKVNLTANDRVSESEPHWSPDGTRIAFLSDRDEAEGPGDVYVMNVNGSGASKVAEREIKGGDIDWGPAPPPAVVLTKAKLVKKAFAGAKGTKLRFRLSRAAKVTATITRLAPKPRKAVKASKLNGKAGNNQVSFGRKLKRGKYTVVLIARAADGTTSKAVKLGFRVR
jgi:Tol biopolymer transport system component